MTFKEFYKRYNKCDKFGVITLCSIIDMEGNIIFQGSVEEAEKYHDNNIQKGIFRYHNSKLYMNNVELFGFTNLDESLLEYPSYKKFIENLK